MTTFLFFLGVGIGVGGSIVLIAVIITAYCILRFVYTTNFYVVYF